MIRPSPTTIVLGRSDLKDYSKRRRRRALREVEEQRLREEAFMLSLTQYSTAPEGPNFDLHAPDANHPLLPHVQLPSQDPRSAIALKNEEHSSAIESSHPGDEDELDYVPVEREFSPENTTNHSGRSPSPDKDGFYYGGFVQSPSQGALDAERTSSPFGN
jgi:hypothetical protein